MECESEQFIKPVRDLLLLQHIPVIAPLIIMYILVITTSIEHVQSVMAAFQI